MKCAYICVGVRWWVCDRMHGCECLHPPGGWGALGLGALGIYGQTVCDLMGGGGCQGLGHILLYMRPCFVSISMCHSLCEPCDNQYFNVALGCVSVSYFLSIMCLFVIV